MPLAAPHSLSLPHAGFLFLQQAKPTHTSGPHTYTVFPECVSPTYPHALLPLMSLRSLYKNITTPKRTSQTVLTETVPYRSLAPYSALFFFVAFTINYTYMFIALSLTSPLECKFHEDSFFCFTHSRIPRMLHIVGSQ